MSSQITIGNNNYVGKNVSVINGKVIVDGLEVEAQDGKIIHIQAEHIETLQVDRCQELTIGGDVGSVDMAHGNIRINGDVKGNVSLTHGNIGCGNVGGYVSVTVGNVRTGRD